MIIAQAFWKAPSNPLFVLNARLVGLQELLECLLELSDVEPLVVERDARLEIVSNRPLHGSTKDLVRIKECQDSTVGLAASILAYGSCLKISWNAEQTVALCLDV